MRIDLIKMRDLIAAKPGIRTVQICDKLDCDMETLEEALDAEVERGVIVKYPVIGPNKRKASAYRMAGIPEPDQQPEKPETESVPAPQPNPAPPPAPVPRQLPPAEEPPIPSDHKGDKMQATNGYTPRPGTKVALAAAALLGGPMNCVQLGATMHIQPKSVHAMLATARENELIVALKDENGLAHFALANTPIDARFTAAAGIGRKVQPHFHQARKPHRNSQPQTAAISPTMGAAKIPHHASMKKPVPRFLAGLLSNGELLISDGTDAITLCKDHTDQLITYLDRARSHV